MLNYPQTIPQLTPQTQPAQQPQLDEASKTVGFDINNYVFGSDSFNSQAQQNNQIQQNGNALPSDKPVQVKKRDFKDVLMGVLLLGGIFAIGTSLLNRATGKDLISEAVKKIGKIFKKTPTP